MRIFRKLRSFRVIIFAAFLLMALVSIISILIFKRTPILALAIPIITALGLSTWLVREFAVPLARLTRTARKIAAGEFPQRIVHKAHFEIGKLEDSVEKMSFELDKMFYRLSTEKGRLAALLGNMAEAVIAVNRDAQIILVNPTAETLFSVLQPEAKGLTVRESIRNNEIADLFEELLRKGTMVEREIAIVSPIQASFAASGSPIKDSLGTTIGAVCVLHDITELKKLENYRTEFVANVSHELKTPLTAIRNYVETLLGGAINDPAHNIEFLQKIEKHTLNLSALIDDILEISRLESKRETNAFAPLDLVPLFHRAIETVAGKAEKKGVELVANCPAEPLIILGIEDHLYRAFLNLLDNAINYTDAGGKVTVSCQPSANNIEVSVQDTGIGIPAEKLSRIFERFFRVDQARSRDLGGTGLGLAIVKHVMSLHNGSVAVTSEENKGSKFTLIFPRQ
ncbi:MAG: ATP-binding protein [Candidatus Margulisiibacteriota bacterium]